MAHLIVKFCTKSGICGEVSTRDTGIGDLIIEGVGSLARRQLESLLKEANMDSQKRFREIMTNPDNAHLILTDHHEVHFLFTKLLALC